MEHSLDTHTSAPDTPEEWRKVPLSAVADVRFSSVDKLAYPSEEPVRLCNYTDVYKNDYIAAGLEFMRASATRKEIDRFGLRVGDVIITKDSETPYDIGIPAVVDHAEPDIVCGYHLGLIRPDTCLVDPTFLAKQIGHERVAHYFAGQANGLTRYGLPIGSVNCTPICLPPPAEQKAIGRLFRLLDQAILQTQENITKHNLIRTGLQHDLLTRGLDKNGKLRDPITNPQQFSKTSLGLLPKEWKISRLGLHATHLTSGSRGWASHYSREGSIFLRIGNLTREHINLRLDDLIRVRPPPGSEGERTRTQPQDILISITADLGIIGVIPDEFPEAFVNQHIALVRPASDMVARWTSRFLAFGPAARHFRLLNDSGAKAGMSLPSVESLLIAIPSLEEQREASRILDELDDSIAREERITEKLIAMKRGLVDDILSGRVRVPQDLELE